MPNGAWTYSSNLKTRYKRFTPSGYVWSQFENSPPGNINITFCDGTICGTYRIKTASDDIIGQFGDNGIMKGKWVFQDSNSSEEMNFVGGILGKHTYRFDGQFRNNTDSELLEFINQMELMSMDERTAFCKKNRLTMKFIPLEMKWYSYLYDRDFKVKETGGEKPYKNCGQYISIERTPLKTLNQIGFYYNNVDYKKLLEEFESDLSENDLAKLKEAISEQEIRENEEKELKEIVTQSQQIQNSCSALNLKLEEYTSFSQILKNIQKEWDKRYSLLEPQSYGNGKMIFKKDITTHKEAKERMQLLITEGVPMCEKINIFYNNAETLKTAPPKIKKLYQRKGNSDINSVLYGNAESFNKPDLYHTYVKIYDYYVSKMEKSTDINYNNISYVADVSNFLVVLCEKMEQLRDGKTKSLEKGLKSATLTIEQQADLIIKYDSSKE